MAAAPHGPIVIKSLKNDRSAPLRDEQGQVGPNGQYNQGHRALRSGNLNTNGPSSAGQVQTSPGAPAMPSTSTNFEGGSNAEAVLPPDPNGDIGPNHYVQWVNLHYQIWNRAGVSILGPKLGNSLWAGFGGVCQTTNQGDPVVRYDRMADRWVFSQFAFALDQNNNPVPPYVQCFAVSATGDPTGAYNRYAFQISNVNFNDYPKLAVWPDAYYMTFNYFDLTKLPANQFQGAGAVAFDRAKMLNGQPATAVSFTTSIAYGGLLASDLDGSVLPPAGSPNYFAGIDTNVAPSGSTLQIWKFHVDFATPANSTFGTSTNAPDFNLAVPTYRWFLCSGARSCLKQPGTNQGLDAIPDRLMNRLQYRRFADGHESLIANHTIGIGTTGNQAAIRWYEVRNLATVPTIYQQGTYSPSTDSRWMGSIAMDQSGDVALGYSVSSTTVSPSIRYTGQLAGDPLGTLPQGEATLIAGGGSQTSTSNRWGDYSMMAVDPTDDCTFWYTQEYYAATSDHGWQTRVGSFKYPNCGQPWYASFGTGNTPTSWAVNQTQTYTVTVTNNGNQTWPASGANPVHLSAHFKNTAGTWLTDQRFSLPNDVAPGASATLTISVTAPNVAGNLVLEYQMVKELQFWFAQVADVNVTTNLATWSATYATGNTPTSWAVNQTQTYTVTVTNNGDQTWPASGANPVHLSAHFKNTAGTWLTDQRFSLPNDVAPGASATLTISVTAPNVAGNLVLEYQMVKELQFWFNQVAAANVTVA